MSSRKLKDVATYNYLAPNSDRGFSVEFEYVAREVTAPVWESFKRNFKNILASGAVTDHGTPVTFEDNLSNLSALAQILAVRECFYHAQDNPKLLFAPCQADQDCALSQYCMDCGECMSKFASRWTNLASQNHVLNNPEICGACPAKKGKFCKPRASCKDAYNSRGCPPVLARWNWEKDGSVVPLTPSQATLLGGEVGETVGVPFETTAPGPPHVLSGASGMQAVVEVLTTLKHIGTQAGPSQGLHVHVNVASDKAPGKKLSIMGLASVWVAWVKYQLVIDEMLSPGRIGNYYAKSLVFGNCDMDKEQDTCKFNPCSCIKRFFHQMRKYVHQLAGSADRTDYPKARAEEFCNKVLSLPGSRFTKPCSNRYPNQRYFAVNLVSLAKFGTLEFRAHSASFDPDRIGRWVQFLVGFIDHFGAGPGRKTVAEFLTGQPATEFAYTRLREAQQRATMADLFHELGDKVSSDTMQFYAQRRWEKASSMAICHPSGSIAFLPIVPDGNCQVPQRDVERIVRATVTKTAATGTRVFRVDVPTNLAPGDYVQVEMPEGDMRTLMVPYHAIASEYFTFEDSPQLEGQAIAAAISITHRCCCNTKGQECKWFTIDQLSTSGKCPRVHHRKDQSSCLLDRFMIHASCWLESSRRHHSPGMCEAVYHSDNPSAYFEGDFCSS